MFECAPPPPPVTFFFVSKYFSPIHTHYQSGILGQGRGRGQGQQSKKRWKINEKKKISIIFEASTVQMYQSINGCNCCKQVSRCLNVYI